MSDESEVVYDCQKYATIRAFLNDDESRVVGLLGPFGCLSAETQFLTPFGWKRIADYANGDKVAQWSEVTGHIEFVCPTAYTAAPCNELISFDSGGLVMELSEDHRVPHRNWQGAFQVRTAGHIARRPSRREIPTTFRGPQGGGLPMSDDLIRFAVMMHADGHYPPQGLKAAVCVRKARKKERVRAILSALGVEWTEHSHKGRPTETTFRFVPPYIGKRYTAEWYSANEAQLRVIMDEVCYWDGLVGPNGDHPERRYFSSNKADAEFIQYAAHATGLRATLRVQHHNRPGWKPSWKLHIRRAGSAKNTAAIREHTKITRFRPHDGRMYCFTVPTGFFVARCRDTIFVTGNSGKSSACVVKLVELAATQPPGRDGVSRTRWIIVRNTYGELHDTTIKTFFQWFPPMQCGHYNESKHTYLLQGMGEAGPFEAEILFRALDRPDHVGKLLSLEITGGWINEAREVPFEIVKIVQARMGRYPAKVDGGPRRALLMMDTNPPDTESWWYDLFENKKPKGVRLFRQPSGRSKEAENTDNLPATYYADMASLLSEDEAKVYIDGEYGFIRTGRPVYPAYKDSLHCREFDFPVPGLTIWRGWDFGLTPACIMFQVLPTGQVRIGYELCAERSGIDAFSDLVLRHCREVFRKGMRYEDIGDPAGDTPAQTDETSCFDILRGKDIDIRGGEVALQVRIESVDLALRTLLDNGEPQLLLHPRCKVLRKGFAGGYQYKRLLVKDSMGEMRHADKPDKNRFSHIHDALNQTLPEIFGDLLRNRRASLGSKDTDQQHAAAGDFDPFEV